MQVMADVKDFRVSIKVRNNRLIELREQLGFSQAEASRRMGWKSPGPLLEYEGLKNSPLESHRSEDVWKRSARRIAEFYGVSPGWIWPESVREVRVATMTAKADASELSPRVVGGDERHSAGELKQLLRGARDSLRPGEREVVRGRFGVGGPERSIREISADMGLSSCRVRQIEQEAIRKLRGRPALAGFVPPKPKDTAPWCMPCAFPHRGECEAWRTSMLSALAAEIRLVVSKAISLHPLNPLSISLRRRARALLRLRAEARGGAWAKLGAVALRGDGRHLGVDT
jgi:DNA-directed RNA polymerase specialized sigma24 family protein